MIKAAESNVLYLKKVLFAFMPGPHKVAKDSQGLILERYRQVSSSEMTFRWMELLSYADGFEPIPVDISELDDDEQRCLMLCRATKGIHMSFIDSLQTLQSPLNINNAVVIKGEEVLVRDKDEAISLMSSPNVRINFQNSIIANGHVIDSNNNNTNNYDER